MDHDAAHKYIHGLLEVAADLLRLVIPGWVDELDLATLEDRSSEYLDATHRKRLGDMAWQVSFRSGRRRGGAGGRAALGAAHCGVQRQQALDRNWPGERLRTAAFGPGSAGFGAFSATGVPPAGGGRSLDIGGAAGGGLALGKPGVGDSAAAGGRDASRSAPMLAGGVGPISRPSEQGVPTGAARLGAGAVGAQDWQRHGLPGL